VGPGDFDFLVRFKEGAFVEKRDAAEQARPFGRCEWFVGCCFHAE
jgi:hypothetical protein